MELKSRYGSIIKHNNSYFLFMNEGNIHFTCYTSMYELDNKFNLIKKNVIFNEKGHISHNLCIFKSKNKKEFYAIGGKNRNQEPWNDHLININNKYKIGGIYLLKSFDIFNWMILNEEKPIIYKNYPKNGVINFEEKYPLFDGNICCFYSKILNKYILYCRANIQRGIRFVQYTTSDNLIDWSEFNIIESNNFDKKKNNYYTFNCIEINKFKIFFALVPFTNDFKNPTEYSIRKLISYDGINWQDIGILFNGKAIGSNNIIRNNTHVAGIFYIKNEKKLYIFLHHNYYSNKCSINLYKFNINKVSQLNEIFIKNINKFYITKYKNK